MRLVRSLAALALVTAAAGLWMAIRVSRPYQGFSGERFIDFPRGTTAGAMADVLERAGVIRSRWDFLAVRAWERGRKLLAGEYRFGGPASPLEVYGRIARGDIFYYELVVPEGKNLFDIAAAIEQLGLFPADRFLAAARNPAPIRDLDPRAPTLEGYLFPNTYRLSRHTTPQRLCRIMTDQFREVWRGLHTSANVHDTVTLASMVEKEGKLAGERPRIAAVFANRLRIGMKLDCDPTTIYAALLDGRYRGVIHRSDLASANAYNTYQHPGLPPGPIANPGLASLQAALEPAASDALYFVLRADASGGHEFTRSMEAQEANIEKYRRALKKRHH